MNLIATATLPAAKIPSAQANLDELIEFAHTFSGYDYWGTFELCAEIADSRDHASIDKLRTCLFFEARRSRHSGEDPDEEGLAYWRCLVAEIRERLRALDAASPEWLANAIQSLAPDEAVEVGTPGYNVYATQKYHWLGWLDPSRGTGTYQRRSSPSARTVYNRIGEPKMLLWLITAAGVNGDLVARANQASAPLAPLASRCKAIRDAVPWRVVAEALMNGNNTAAVRSPLASP